MIKAYLDRFALLHVRHGLFCGCERVRSLETANTSLAVACTTPTRTAEIVGAMYATLGATERYAVLIRLTYKKSPSPNPGKALAIKQRFLQGLNRAREGFRRQ